MTNSAELPDEFTRFRELFVIHLYKILEIPKKQPIHAVALLVVIAVEALSKLLDEDPPKTFFAREYLGPKGVPEDVGRDLFDSLRNGLAHVYAPYPIHVGSRIVWPTLSWKDGAHVHLHLTGVTVDDAQHQHLAPLSPTFREAVLVLNVETMYEDLVALFGRIELGLRHEPELREVVIRRASEIRAEEAKRPEGSARTSWEEFISARQLTELSAPRREEE